MVYIVDDMNSSPFEQQEDFTTEQQIVERNSNESKEFEFLVELDDVQSTIQNEYVSGGELL